MAHRKRPTRTSEGSSAAYHAAMKKFKGEHKSGATSNNNNKEGARINKPNESLADIKARVDAKSKPKTEVKPKTKQKKNKLKPAPWGRNDDGSPKKQPSASSQTEIYNKSVAKRKALKKGKVEREENEWGPGGQPSASKQIKQQKDNEKAAWLKKTRNSPAAKSGAFTDDERWSQQQKHRKWKSDRKASSDAKKKAREEKRAARKAKRTPEQNERRAARKSWATMTKAQRKRARR